MNQNNYTYFYSLLALLFIGLKFTGYIAWPWWWVLSPLWAPILLVLFILFILFLYVFIFVV